MGVITPTCILFLRGKHVEVNTYDADGRLINREELHDAGLLEISNSVSGVRIVRSQTSDVITVVCEVMEGTLKTKGRVLKVT